ncbi:MAG: hypothetical protein ACOY4K_06300 [Pseudomonadota bacterium]
MTVPHYNWTFRGRNGVVIDRGDGGRIVFTAPLGTDDEMLDACLAWMAANEPPRDPHEAAVRKAQAEHVFAGGQL